MRNFNRRIRQGMGKVVMSILGLGIVLIFAASAYTNQLNVELGNQPGNMSGSVIFTVGGAFLLVLAVLYLGRERRRMAV